MKIKGKEIVNFWQIPGPYNVELEDGTKLNVSRSKLRLIINNFYKNKLKVKC